MNFVRDWLNKYINKIYIYFIVCPMERKKIERVQKEIKL